jgi:hypothetical protein
MIFCSGTARGGTNLLNLCLSVHPEIQVCQDPLLPFFKSFRAQILDNALIASDAEKSLNSPLDEYYYFESKLQVMDLIQEATLDIGFDQDSFPALRNELQSRMSFSSPKLIPYLGDLTGASYSDVFRSAIDIMETAWGKSGIEFPGFNDNWAIEFFRPVATTFPDAKFIALIRDVRSSVASHIRLVEHKSENPLYQYEKSAEMVALTMSFVRSWRKQVSFIAHYQASEFADRFYWLRYEDLVTRPDLEIERVCDFLGVEFKENMVDTTQFVSPDGNKWLPNSNHVGVPREGIYSSTVDRWRSSLAPEAVELIEFIAGPDLVCCGYPLSKENHLKRFPLDAFNYHCHDSENCSGWRTDNMNSEIDFGLELMRESYLTDRLLDRRLDRELFLHYEMADLLRSGAALSRAH